MGRISMKEKPQPIYQGRSFFPPRSVISRTLRGFIGSFSSSDVTTRFHPLTVTVPGLEWKPKEGFPLLSATSQGVTLKANYQLEQHGGRAAPALLLERKHVSTQPAAVSTPQEGSRQLDYELTKFVGGKLINHYQYRGTEWCKGTTGQSGCNAAAGSHQILVRLPTFHPDTESLWGLSQPLLFHRHFPTPVCGKRRATAMHIGHTACMAAAVFTAATAVRHFLL